MFSAHMDTVGPGHGIRPVFRDGVFTSSGDTILGADDKSAIAVILEAVAIIRENDLPHAPMDLVFTVCEEIGLLGARNLDWGLVRARKGYVLDATDTDGIIVRAPSANHFEIRLRGKAAHAGAAPEKGINAIVLAAQAISGLPNGRIDPETTCNIGRIEGGSATNIVPDRVTITGEIRSHDERTLAELTDTILSRFENTVMQFTAGDAHGSAGIESVVERSFSRTHLPIDHPLVQLAQQAAHRLGRIMRTKTSGGGSDANVFFEHGIAAGVLGTGMRDVHSTGEHVAIDDMVRAVQLLVEIVGLHVDKRGARL
jgi:tripeptide aminopeptidase